MELISTVLTVLYLLLSFWDWQVTFKLGRKEGLDNAFRAAMIALAAYLIWENFMAFNIPGENAEALIELTPLQFFFLLIGMLIHIYYLRGNYQYRKKAYDKLKKIR